MHKILINSIIVIIGLLPLILCGCIMNLYMLIKDLIFSDRQKLNIQNYSKQSIQSYLSELNQFIDFILYNKIKKIDEKGDSSSNLYSFFNTIIQKS